MRTKNIGTEMALKRIKQFAAYQERSHREVKIKLYSYGLYKQEVDLLLAQLIEENFLDEERFAIAFAGGKFRIRQWGKVKIKYELKQRGVSDYCIKKALASIDDQSYTATLHKLYEQKLKNISGADPYIKKCKVIAYLVQKGFETNLIYKIDL